MIATNLSIRLMTEADYRFVDIASKHGYQTRIKEDAFLERLYNQHTNSYIKCPYVQSSHPLGTSPQQLLSLTTAIPLLHVAPTCPLLTLLQLLRTPSVLQPSCTA